MQEFQSLRMDIDGKLRVWLLVDKGVKWAKVIGINSGQIRVRKVLLSMLNDAENLSVAPEMLASKIEEYARENHVPVTGQASEFLRACKGMVHTHV